MNKRYLIFDRKTQLLQSKVQPRIAKMLNKQVREFIDDYKRLGYNAAVTNLNKFNLDFLPLLNEIYRKAGLIGARITDNELREAVKEGQKAASFGRAAQWIAQVLEYLGTNGLEFVQRINETTRERILEILQRGIDEQLSIQQIANQLTDVSRTRAITIARTEIIRAANIGHQVAAQQFPFEVNKKWVAARDPRTRDSHVKVNGITIDEDDFFKVPIYKKGKITGYDNMMAPGDPEAAASNTINCFLPNELTNVNPKIVKCAFRSWYNGKVITVQTSGGQKFTCTPNHPILTTTGWVNAGDLTNAHNLVKSSFINSNALPEFNVNHPPSTFEQMFNSFDVVGVGVRMPRAIVNFNGDLPASDVDIVWPGGKLPFRVKPGLTKSVKESPLQNSNLGKGKLLGFSLLNSGGVVKLLWQISHNLISLFNQFLSFFRFGLCHSQVHRFASIAGINTPIFKPSSYNIPGNSIFSGKLFNANSIFKIFNNINGGKVNFFHSSNAVINENLVNKAGTHADTIADFLSTHSGLVHSDNVIGIVAHNYEGFVYTFETDYQMYDINSYVARNCRCRITHIPKRDAKGNLIRRNPNQARIIPLRPTTITSDDLRNAIAASVKMMID